MERRKAGGREVILEFYQVGDYVRVSAMDAATLTETIIVGSAKATRDELERLAIRKLEWVLAKAASQPGTRR
ncbi:MAG: hypothetical protein V3V17_10355 [Alphaproteobacteria bacterium]